MDVANLLGQLNAVWIRGDVGNVRRDWQSDRGAHFENVLNSGAADTGNT